MDRLFSKLGVGWWLHLWAELGLKVVGTATVRPWQFKFLVRGRCICTTWSGISFENLTPRSPPLLSRSLLTLVVQLHRTFSSLDKGQISSASQETPRFSFSKTFGVRKLSQGLEEISLAFEVIVSSWGADAAPSGLLGESWLVKSMASGQNIARGGGWLLVQKLGTLKISSILRWVLSDLLI